MKAGLAITGRDLVQALGNLAALPVVDATVRARADAAADALRAAGTVTRVLRRAAGDYAVSVEGDGAFAREFGSVDAEAEPFVRDAVVTP